MKKKILGWTLFVICLPLLILMYVIATVGVWASEIFQHFYDPIYELMGKPFDRY